MDPDAAHAEMMRQAREVLDDVTQADPSRLAELVIALDEWITRGGFLPRRWRVGGQPVVPDQARQDEDDYTASGSWRDTDGDKPGT